MSTQASNQQATFVLDCGHEPTPDQQTPGYGQDKDGRRLCYACCADLDRQVMRDEGRIVLYLSEAPDPGEWKLSNWPGSLVFWAPQLRVKKGGHFIASTRYDVWFTFEGSNWHGVRYGEFSQLCYCRRLKGANQ